jgi:hypothetical protein
MHSQLLPFLCAQRVLPRHQRSVQRIEIRLVKLQRLERDNPVHLRNVQRAQRTDRGLLDLGEPPVAGELEDQQPFVGGREGVLTVCEREREIGQDRE